MRSHRILFIATLAAGALVVGNQLSIASGATSTGRVASSQSSIRGVDCSSQKSLCVEVHDSDEVFGHYVGHDEPSLLFDSTLPGSGNQMRYSGILPKEPAPSNVPGQRSYDFNLYATFWFGMAMCATQSYPNTVKSCIRTATPTSLGRAARSIPAAHTWSCSSTRRVTSSSSTASPARAPGGAWR
jgi:hypothetical protein